MSARAIGAGLRGTALSTGLALLLAGALAAGARADVFGAKSLLSASPLGQAEEAHDPALSADGRYIVFDGPIGGVRGVWRRSTEPGSPFEQVAGGNAELPSVSADGRYVSFTTNEGESLAAITNGLIQTGTPNTESPGVYVRDMSKEPVQAGAFALASARDGSTASLTYQYREQTEGTGQEREEARRFEESRFGSTAAGRSAISADGRHVAFVTTARSDLSGANTPALQVATRNLDTLETQLVSVRSDPTTGRPYINAETGRGEPVPEAPENQGEFGAVYTEGSPPAFEGREQNATGVPQLPGAAISADASTVAWLGQQIGQQARLLSAETLGPRYAEPLWRRVADGPTAPTRRVSGGSDPENPECRAHPEAVLPVSPSLGDPCQGPFAAQDTAGAGTWNKLKLADTIPRLSANGEEVAFLASAPLVSQLGGFGSDALSDDAYLVDMTKSSRVAALRQLTQFASSDTERVSTNGQLEDIGISPDGSQVAFTTARTTFPLGTPAFVSVPAAVPGLVELYDVDLSNDTLTRVTTGYESGLSARPHEESINEDPYGSGPDGALSPSFGADGSKLAFSSTASNLVYGDGNTPPARGFGAKDGSDAFIIDRVLFNPEPTTQVISQPPANPAPRVTWKLSLEALSLRNGTVELAIEVPSGGRLGANASSALRIRVGHRLKVVHRNVASLARTIGATSTNPSRFTLVLRPGYRRLAARRGGLAGKLSVTFTAPGHPTLRGSVTVRFLMRHGGGR